MTTSAGKMLSATAVSVRLRLAIISTISASRTADTPVLTSVFSTSLNPLASNVIR